MQLMPLPQQIFTVWTASVRSITASRYGHIKCHTRFFLVMVESIIK